MHRPLLFGHFQNASQKSCSVRELSTACDSASNCIKMAVFHFYLQPENQRIVGWVEGASHVVFWLKNPRWKRKCETVRRCDATATSFVVEVRDEVFADFHAVIMKRHSNMRNSLFALPGWILCEQSPWWQRKWWACSWLFSWPVSRFSVSVSLCFPCTVHASFIVRLSNLCQGLRRTCSEIWKIIDAVPLPDPWRNRIRPDTRPSSVKFCALTPQIWYYYRLPLHCVTVTV
jgi:hypothetical protein